MASSVHDKNEATGRWIKIAAGEFRQKFDRTSFALPHELASHPLFQLPALIELAERTRKQHPGDIYSAAITPGVWAMKTYNEDEETWVAPARKPSPFCKSGDSGNYFRPGAP